MVLMVRIEISSILGRKIANRAPLLDRGSLRSQGERAVRLNKKSCSAANAIPNVNPSDLCTVVSPQGRKSLFVSAAVEILAKLRTTRRLTRRERDPMVDLLAIAGNFLLEIVVFSPFFLSFLLAIGYLQLIMTESTGSGRRISVMSRYPIPSSVKV